MMSATIGRYHIVQEVGRGGMGVIYKGHDPILERSVAIKILSQQLVQNPEMKERFIREAQAAARLNHPFIAGIYDINEHEGIYYIVFEFIEGQSLDKILAETQAMPLPKTLEYFIPVCQALDYAHQHGIVHRDVKPGNILVADTGEVKVADFGIAWVETANTLTQPGEILGSFYYFSPEQARGEKVDRRADIYSLGVMLYEMLTGKLPFKADNPAALIQLHLTAEPKPPTLYNSAIPKKVEAAILKAMQKDASDRFQNLADFIKELEVEEVREDLFKTSISPAEASLHNILGNNYYKQGKLDLAVLEWQKATKFDPYNALTHNNLGTAFDGLGKLEDAIREYNEAVLLNPNNFVAHYNLGSAYYRNNDLDHSIEEYRKVTVLNPKFAPAYYNLGNAYYLKGKKEEAVSYWQKALEQDPQFAIALFNMGSVEMGGGNEDKAIDFWNKAMEINPNFGEAHYNLGNYHYEKGNVDEAIKSWEKAAAAKFGFWEAHYNLGNAYYTKQVFEEAILQWQKTVQFKEDYWPAHWNLANTFYFDMDQIEPAINEWQRTTQINSSHWQSFYNLGEAYLYQGKLELAIMEWDRVVSLNPRFWHVYHNLGCLLYKKGKIEQAVAYWSKAVALMLFSW